MENIACKLCGARLLRDLVHYRSSFFELAHYISLSLNVSELFTLPWKHVYSLPKTFKTHVRNF